MPTLTPTAEAAQYDRVLLREMLEQRPLTFVRLLAAVTR